MTIIGELLISLSIIALGFTIVEGTSKICKRLFEIEQQMKRNKQ